MQLQITIDSKALDGAIEKLLDTMKDLTPVKKHIAEYLLESTRERIRSGGPAPDGAPWAPLSPAYLLTKKGKGTLQETGRLIGLLRWQIDGDGNVAVGSDRDYAAIHQMGGTIHKKARDGSARLRRVGSNVRFAKKSHKKAWGVSFRVGAHEIHIPARPYLGLSAADKAEVVEIAKEHLEAALRG
jgi:phage virion morphogenesis protein